MRELPRPRALVAGEEEQRDLPCRAALCLSTGRRRVRSRGTYQAQLPCARALVEGEGGAEGPTKQSCPVPEHW